MPVPIVALTLLALVSTIRPSSLVAVYALARERSPRLMAAYVVAGLAFTVTVGVIIILAFKGVHLHSGTNRTKSIAQIIAGVLAIVLGLAVLSGRLGPGSPDEHPSVARRLEARLSGEITTRGALFAGPATHIPGVLYLIALNLIVASEIGFAGRLFQVLFYNALWFALPLGALVICVVNPAAADRAVDALQAWTTSHARAILLAVCFGLGVALLVNGALGV